MLYPLSYEGSPEGAVRHPTRKPQVDNEGSQSPIRR